MLWFDVTKAAAQSHRSGLTRVSARLQAELARLGAHGVGGVCWHPRRRAWMRVEDRQPVTMAPGDCLFTPELFSDEERPGIGEWLGQSGASATALFHDAIPLRMPEVTWPQSVKRHPHYMRLLARFGRVFAVSEASARELSEYWESNHIPAVPVVPITLGADGHGLPRVVDAPPRVASRSVLMIGILEPRKNQDAVLDAVEALVREGLDFEVTFVGRVNPHFGRPVAKRIQRMARSGHRVVHLDAIDDESVAALMKCARFSVMPSRAEGCGLPVLESLWAGLPVLASALPSIVESARGGGCLLVPPDDGRAWTDGMRQLLRDAGLLTRLQAEACARELPRWADTAAMLLRGLQPRVR